MRLPRWGGWSAGWQCRWCPFSGQIWPPSATTHHGGARAGWPPLPSLPPPTVDGGVAWWPQFCARGPGFVTARRRLCCGHCWLQGPEPLHEGHSPFLLSPGPLPPRNPTRTYLPLGSDCDPPCTLYNCINYSHITPEMQVPLGIDSLEEVNDWSLGPRTRGRVPRART